MPSRLLQRVSTTLSWNSSSSSSSIRSDTRSTDTSSTDTSPTDTSSTDTSSLLGPEFPHPNCPPREAMMAQSAMLDTDNQAWGSPPSFQWPKILRKSAGRNSGDKPF